MQAGNPELSVDFELCLISQFYGLVSHTAIPGFVENRHLKLGWHSSWERHSFLLSPKVKINLSKISNKIIILYGIVLT